MQSAGGWLYRAWRRNRPNLGLAHRLDLEAPFQTRVPRIPQLPQPRHTHTQTFTLSRASHITAAPPAPFPRHFPAPLPPAVNLEGLTLPNQTLSVHCRAGTATTSAAQTRRLRVGVGGGEVEQGGRPSPFLLPPARGSLRLQEGGEGSEGATVTTCPQCIFVLGGGALLASEIDHSGTNCSLPADGH